jgi:ferrous iron transport protein B
VPVVPTVATRGAGVPELRAEIGRQLGAPPPRLPWRWPERLAGEFSALAQRFRGGLLLQRALLDEGGLAEETLAAREGPALRAALAESRARLRAAGSHPAELETRLRYNWISAALESCVERRATGPSLTDRLDAVLTHRVFGLLIFAAVMAAMFFAIFEGAAPFMEAIRRLCGWLGEQIAAGFAGTRLAGGALESLLVHGVLAGVGGVLVFLPQIFFLFLFLAVLEDCGYLARAAFLMDRALRFCGLSGHSFIPLMSCFACAVPGVMAARTIADPRDRLATILVAPLMSCSARIPVYTLMIAAFIPPLTVCGFLPLQGVVFAGLYLLGILIAIPVALLLKRFMLRGADPGFMLELPVYTRPTPRNVAWRVWAGVRAFVLRAGSVIFVISILIWALSYFPRPAAVGAEYDGLRAQARQELHGPALDERLAQLDRHEAGAYLRQSFFGRAGRLVEPLVRPLGWDWRIGMAALASFPAREVVVSTLQIVYDLGDEEGESAGRGALIGEMRAATWPDGRRIFTLPVALSLVVFFALCCQCGATLAVVRRETNSWRWPAFAFAYLTALAYAGALLTYQIGTAISAR